MSANGNDAFSAAILSRLNAQQDAMRGLFSAVESSVAELADPERAKGVETILAAMESAMAELVSIIEGRDVPEAIDRLVKAIADNKPTITVNVPPPAALPALNLSAQSVALLAEAMRNVTVNVEAVMPALPAPVNHIMPAPEQKPRKWKVTMPGNGYNAPDRVMTIEQL